MYYITAMRDGSFDCSYSVQDGTEEFKTKTRKEAVQRMISAARIMNGSFIREDDISFSEEGPPSPLIINEVQYALLNDIQAGKVVIISRDDLRIKYRISDDECKMIIKIREGDLRVVENRI